MYIKLICDTDTNNNRGRSKINIQRPKQQLRKHPRPQKRQPRQSSAKIKSKAPLGQVATASRRARQLLRPGRLTQVLSCQLVSLVRHRWTAMGPPHYSPCATVAAHGGAFRAQARARVNGTSIPVRQKKATQQPNLSSRKRKVAPTKRQIRMPPALGRVRPGRQCARWGAFTPGAQARRQRLA
jgi:hypothetical protein